MVDGNASVCGSVAPERDGKRPFRRVGHGLCGVRVSSGRQGLCPSASLCAQRAGPCTVRWQSSKLRSVRNVLVLARCDGNARRLSGWIQRTGTICTLLHQHHGSMRLHVPSNRLIPFTAEFNTRNVERLLLDISIARPFTSCPSRSPLYRPRRWCC